MPVLPNCFLVLPSPTRACSPRRSDELPRASCGPFQIEMQSHLASPVDSSRSALRALRHSALMPFQTASSLSCGTLRARAPCVPRRFMWHFMAEPQPSAGQLYKLARGCFPRFPSPDRPGLQTVTPDRGALLDLKVPPESLVRSIRHTFNLPSERTEDHNPGPRSRSPNRLLHYLVNRKHTALSYLSGRGPGPLT